MLHLILIESDSFRTRTRPRLRKVAVRWEVTRYTFEDEYEDDDEDEACTLKPRVELHENGTSLIEKETLFLDSFI